MVNIVDKSESLSYASPTLEEVKEYLLNPTETHSGMISRLLLSAFEKAEHVTGRSLTTHNYQMEIFGHDGAITLLRSPIKSVDKVQYYDGSSWNDVDSTNYDTVGISEITIHISTLYQRVRIEYTTEPYINSVLNKLIMDLVQVWYDNKPDAEDIEQMVVNRMAKFKVWQVE